MLHGDYVVHESTRQEGAEAALCEGEGDPVRIKGMYRGPLLVVREHTQTVAAKTFTVLHAERDAANYAPKHPPRDRA